MKYLVPVLTAAAGAVVAALALGWWNARAK